MAHIPVLSDEIIALLSENRLHPLQRVIDGTLGAGGHTRALLQAGAEQVLAFDLDEQAIALAAPHLADYTGRVQIRHASYVEMGRCARELGWQGVDAILLDLGLSSMQLDTPERGFAFKHDAPLDMRFDATGGAVTAADVVNQWTADDLAEIFYRYGEEPHSRRIAAAIVRARPIVTTTKLADVVAAAVPHNRKEKIHPATRVFQALRITVNQELESVEKVLPIAFDLLQSGGRLAIITFHSLEDRIVKQFFKDLCTEISAPPGMASIGEKAAQGFLLTRKPIVPGEAEMKQNPRSRSSKLRVIEKY
jgi:16S rRNA (cytosine1402-N4)-methyltransferase